MEILRAACKVQVMLHHSEVNKFGGQLSGVLSTESFKNVPIRLSM
jgi:hypothetical protein